MLLAAPHGSTTLIGYTENSKPQKCRVENDGAIGTSRQHRGGAIVEEEL